MTDAEAATGRINEALAEENERLEEEVRKLRTLLERPVNVNVQSPDSATLKKVGEYLPQLTHLSSNVATVGGELVQMKQGQQGTNIKLDTLIHTMDRIADALDRAFPVMPDAQWNQDQEDGRGQR